MTRREFTTASKAAIIKRATDAARAVRCEECAGAVTRWEIDHTKPDAMETDKRTKLTAAEGRLLCLPCHAAKTKADVKIIARSKRVEARHIGAKRPAGEIKSAPFPATAKVRRERASLPPRQMFRSA